MHTIGKISAESLMSLNIQALRASALGGASAKKSSSIQMVVNMNIDASMLMVGKKYFTTIRITRHQDVIQVRNVHVFIAQITTTNQKDEDHH